MNVTFSAHAWEQYLYWAETDRKTLRKINRLIENVRRTPFDGIGKPEPLRGELSGFWSRRIDREHRLVYRVAGKTLEIASCRYHYDE